MSKPNEQAEELRGQFTASSDKDPFEPFWNFLKPFYELVMNAPDSALPRLQCILTIKLMDEIVSMRKRAAKS